MPADTPPWLLSALGLARRDRGLDEGIGPARVQALQSNRVDAASLDPKFGLGDEAIPCLKHSRP